MPGKLESKAWSCSTLEVGLAHLNMAPTKVKQENTEELERELQDSVCAQRGGCVFVRVCVSS